MKINSLNSQIKFSSLVINDNSEAMGILTREFQTSNYILREYAPRYDIYSPRETKQKIAILDKFSKVWQEFLASSEKNLILSPNRDIEDSHSIESVIAKVEHVKNGKTITLGTVKDKDNIFDFMKAIMKLEKKSWIKRIFHL